MYVANPIISAIESSDNVEMAKIVRAGLTEYGANRPGFAWQDPQLNSLYGLTALATRHTGLRVTRKAYFWVGVVSHL